MGNKVRKYVPHTGKIPKWKIPKGGKKSVFGEDFGRAYSERVEYIKGKIESRGENSDV